MAEPIMFLSNVTCVNTSVSTNVIAAVAMAKGIQCLMAVEDLSCKSMCFLSPPSTNMYVRKYNFICCIEGSKHSKLNTD